MEINNKVYLFLDDIRDPKHVDYILPTEYRSQYRLESWNIVRNYEEFIEFISNKFPDIISFDHDLADEHYLNYDRGITKNEYKEKTGLDCTKWLVEYCITNNKELPEIYCHSMNPVGKDNILNYINNYKRSLDE